MAKKPRDTVPTSVILPREAKAFIKKVADKESRTFSHQVRFVILAWVDFHSKKEKRSGKESEKGGEEGQKVEEVGS